MQNISFVSFLLWSIDYFSNFNAKFLDHFFFFNNSFFIIEIFHQNRIVYWSLKDFSFFCRFFFLIIVHKLTQTDLTILRNLEQSWKSQCCIVKINIQFKKKRKIWFLLVIQANCPFIPKLVIKIAKTWFNQCVVTTFLFYKKKYTLQILDYFFKLYKRE